MYTLYIERAAYILYIHTLYTDRCTFSSYGATTTCVFYTRENYVVGSTHIINTLYCDNTFYYFLLFNIAAVHDCTPYNIYVHAVHRVTNHSYYIRRKDEGPRPHKVGTHTYVCTYIYKCVCA